MTEVLDGQVDLLDLVGWSGKTSPEPSQATPAKTSESSLKKSQGSANRMPLFLDLRRVNGIMPDASWVMGGPLPGVYTMPSFGESPREENASRLSQILQEQAHPKYYLSAKACQGILNRAEKRGKQLPEILEKALRNQSASRNEPENLGGQGNPDSE